MGSSQPPGPALAAAADADPVTLLVTAWLSARRSENTRAAYARDIGITPQQRPGRAPSWLTWCQQQEVHPVTGVTALHVARYARQLDDAGLSPASAARKLAAISSWYAWLARRGHITASPAAGITRPRPGPHPPSAPALTADQVLALIHAADTTPGPQRARTAALITVLLLTTARLSEITSADVADLGTGDGHRVLWVVRANGRRQDLPLPDPAASRIDAYLAGRAGQAGVQALFATRTGRRLFDADVRHTLRRLAARAGLPADLARQLGPRMIRQSAAREARQLRADAERERDEILARLADTSRLAEVTRAHTAELEQLRADAAREREELRTALESRAQVLEESHGELRARIERAERELDTARAELAKIRQEAAATGPPVRSWRRRGHQQPGEPG
jgi:integrase/recombinase XerD